MSNLFKCHPATFIVLQDLLWHESLRNLSLRPGRYRAVSTMHHVVVNNID